MSDYESYHQDSSVHGDDPLWEEEEELEDDASAISEQERAELEVALYSQLHFEHVSNADLTDRSVSGVIIEEEVPGPQPEQHELNWRERLLGNLGRVDRAGAGTGADSVSGTVNHTGVDKQDKLITKPATRKHALRTKPKIGAIIAKGRETENVKQKKVSKKVAIDKFAETNIKAKSAQPIKKSRKLQENVKKKKDSHLDKFLFRKDLGNKVLTLKMKKRSASIKASTPKTKPSQVIVVCTDSDDSDIESPLQKTKKKKIKEVKLSDMIIIDSISSSEADTGDSENPIVLRDSSDLDLSLIETDVVFSSDEDSDITEIDSEESSDESIIEVGADLGTDDIQTNLAGCVKTAHTGHHPREPLGDHAPTMVSLDSLKLNDYSDLTIEDIHLSLGECDWGVVKADKYSGAKSMVGRYFKKLDVTCHNCKEKGHLSKICPMPRKLPVCLHCGIEGHLLRTCPRPVCFNCLKVGHRREKCAARQRNMYGWCNRCGMQGHTKGECTDLWRQYHMTTEEGPLKEVKMESNTRVFCYNCAMEGHWGHECEEERMSRYAIAQLPFIAQYRLDSQVKGDNVTSSPQGQPKRRSACQKGKRTREDNLREYTTSEKKHRGPPAKKRKTQNEKFEAEYQAMGRKLEENWNNKKQHPGGKNSRRKNYPTRLKVDALHAGDFQRSQKGGDKRRGRSEGMRGSNGSDRYNGPRKRRWDNWSAHNSQDGPLNPKRARYDDKHSSHKSPAGWDHNKSVKRKKPFVSNRGFKTYF